MLTLFIGLFVLIASLFISSDKLSVYKFPIAGFLSVLFFGIMFTLFSTEMTLYEKIGWSLVTSLELIAVPLFLYFLIEEKSVPKIIALIIGTALVMFAQELREGELV
jgi:predicted membrane metal-binding protein